MRRRFQALEQEAIHAYQSMGPPTVPVETNAAVLYEQLVGTNFYDLRESPEYEEVLAQEFQGAAADLFFRHHAHTLETLQTASNRDHCRFSDELVRLRAIGEGGVRASLVSAAWLLGEYIRYTTHTGDTESSLDLIACLSRMRGHMISDLRSMQPYRILRYERLIAKSVEHLLGHATVAPGRLRALIDEEFDPMLLGQRSLPWSEAQSKLFIADAHLGSNPDYLNAMGLSDKSPIYREAVLSLVRFRSGRDDIASVANLYAALRGKMSSSPAEEDIYEIRPFGIIAQSPRSDGSLWLGSVSRVSDWHDLNNAVLAAAVYRSNTGRYPRTLEELVPELLSKVPWPTKLKTFPDGLILYLPLDAPVHDEPRTTRDRLRELDFTVYLGAAHDEYRK